MVDSMNPCCCCLLRLPQKGLKTPDIHKGTTRIFADILEECFQIQCLKTEVFNQCVLPMTTYGSETWCFTIGLISRLKVAQRAMERAMLGVSLRDRIRNEEIRMRTNKYMLAVNARELGICPECEGRLRDASDFKLQVQRCQKKLLARLETCHVKKAVPGDDEVIELTDDEERSTDIVKIPDVTSPATQVAPALPESAPATTELPANTSSMNPYECNICLSTFVRKSAFTWHMNKEHGNPAVQPKSDACDSFEKQFTMFCSNNKQPPPFKRYRGPLCVKKVITVHRRELPENKQVKPKKQHSCHICGKIFKRRYKCAEHIYTHTGVKFSCKICNKSFTVHSKLVIHNRIHTGNVFICDICNKQYTHKYMLVKHMRSHTGHKPYVCEICNKQFALKASHDQHKAVHSDVKPYSCDVCDKRFRRKDHLKHHSLQHTGQKPYSCDVCDKKFTMKKYVKRHMENIHGLKNV